MKLGVFTEAWKAAIFERHLLATDLVFEVIDKGDGVFFVHVTDARCITDMGTRVRALAVLIGALSEVVSTTSRPPSATLQ
jgi:hypothetical protein